MAELPQNHSAGGSATHSTRPGPTLVQLAFLWQESGLQESLRLQLPSSRCW